MSHEENNMFRLEWPPEPPPSLHRAELNLIVKPFTIHFDFSHSRGRQLFSVKSSDKPHCTLPVQHQTACCSKVGFFCIVTNVSGILREVFLLLEQNPKGKQKIWPVVFLKKKKKPSKRSNCLSFYNTVILPLKILERNHTWTPCMFTLT